MNTSNESSELICTACRVFSKSVFQTFSADEIARRFKNKQILRFKKNEAIFNENDKERGVFCIYNKAVKIVKKDSGGREHLMKFIKPGEMIGIHGCITPHPYFKSAIAMEDMEVCFISKEDFLDYMNKTPAFLAVIMKYLCLEAEEVDTKMIEMSNKPLKKRFAGALLELANSFGIDQDRRLLIPLAINDIESFLNDTKVNVGDLLQEFMQQEIIDYRDDHVYILSAAKLREFTE